MNTPDLDALRAQAQDDAIVDDYVRRRFGVEPREDRLGLFRGHLTPTPGEPDEEALFQAHMRRFPCQHE
jgi:hypothetical protein